jgi:ATP-dependent helicase YprA (DUF1998 family)
MSPSSCEGSDVCVLPLVVSLSGNSLHKTFNYSGFLDRRMRFVSCTATLANPSRHMQKIFGLKEDEVEVVDIDGAPSGKKDYLVWNPPFIDDLKPGLGRRGTISEATALMRFLMKRGVRVLLFCKVWLSRLVLVIEY